MTYSVQSPIRRINSAPDKMKMEIDFPVARFLRLKSRRRVETQRYEQEAPLGPKVIRNEIN